MEGLALLNAQGDLAGFYQLLSCCFSHTFLSVDTIETKAELPFVLGKRPAYWSSYARKDTASLRKTGNLYYASKTILT